MRIIHIINLYQRKMKINNRVIECIRKEYVAFDGEVFYTEKECLEYETEQKFNLNKAKLPIEDIFLPLNYWYYLTYVFIYDSSVATPEEYLTAINKMSDSEDGTLIAVGDEKNVQLVSEVSLIHGKEYFVHEFSSSLNILQTREELFEYINNSILCAIQES